jgi:hypothetical protein
MSLSRSACAFSVSISTPPLEIRSFLFRLVISCRYRS